jgi:hypothetical protein
MTELALDDVDRDAFARELDGVRMTQLVGRDLRRTPASAASWRSSALAAVAAQRRPRVQQSMTQNSGPGGSETRKSLVGTPGGHTTTPRAAHHCSSDRRAAG